VGEDAGPQEDEPDQGLLGEYEMQVPTPFFIFIYEFSVPCL